MCAAVELLDQTEITMWQNWVSAVFGLWTIVVPFLGLSGATLQWTLVITGAVVAIMSFWAASVESSDERYTRSGRDSGYTREAERRAR
jgi:hypothetical protein